MNKIKVMIVDDAVVVRRIVSDVLSKDPEIEVVGVAANGRIALSKYPILKPDAITLDVEMPEMNGLETLKALRKLDKKIPIIMFSSLTERGALTTLDALASGASDYVTKPENVGSVSIAMQHIFDELVPKIKGLCSSKLLSGGTAGLAGLGKSPLKSSSTKEPARGFNPEVLITTSPVTSGKIDILAVGVSTGGPNALAELLPALPGNLPVPAVIVQHMPPFFTKLLADRLDAKSKITIMEGSAGEILEAGKAWLAPGDYHMVLQKTGANVKIKTNREPLENSCRPAVNALFRSVVKLYGQNVLAVILTGMGQDGLLGCEEVKKAGGQILVQDEESSVVWGMPGFVARKGLAEKVLPLDKLGQEIVERLKVGRLGWSPQ